MFTEDCTGNYRVGGRGEGKGGILELGSGGRGLAQRVGQRRTPEMERQVKTLWVSNIMKAQGTIRSSDLCG